MKHLTKVSLAMLMALGLAACDKKVEDKATATAAESTPQAQVAEKTAAQELVFPTPNPKLLEPIAISDKKSATGLKDLQTLNAFWDKSEVEGNKIKQAFQQKVRELGKDKEALAQFIATEGQKLIDWNKQFDEQLAKLNIQDAEVAAIATRLSDYTQFGTAVLQANFGVTQQASKMSPAEEQALYAKMKESAKFSNQIVQGTIIPAINKLVDKYSK
ncbi:hypothetical protein RO21_10165 [[Actinobacillus] muris]|uniref:Lipoprotein n=1 Tax=Muribacter muris TaxID=67855 RepID=A0A0J5P3A0_9PAST|nr:hypothetical protein [Muribacter muris]KMK50721.1 hypothetical protein RO21_10165 [[Actinobacillus] muris] [Muribacter muris]